MLGMGGGSLIASKVGYAVTCAVAAVVLVVSGYAYKVVSLTEGLGNGVSISNGASVGAMNILVMGLESRTDYEGQTLLAGLLAAMHAGSVYGVENQGVGGQATNTLILIHIFAGGQKAVGFSVPRDDYVTTPKRTTGSPRERSMRRTASPTRSRSARPSTPDELAAALPGGQPGRPGGHHRDRGVGDRPEDRPLRRGEPGRVLLPGPGVRRDRGLPQAVTGDANLHDYNSGFNAVLDGYSVSKGGTHTFTSRRPRRSPSSASGTTCPTGT